MEIDFNVNLEEFDYELPNDKIAEYPLENRDDSKLLIVDKQNEIIRHDVFKNIQNYINKNSLIFINKTKVISARLLMKKSTGGSAEILIINPLYPSSDPQFVMNAKSHCIWECLIGGRRINKGTQLFLSESVNFNLKAEILEKNAQKAIVKFEWYDNITFSEILNEFGHVPLPPYIKREDTEIDKIRYQTVYAKEFGSVAAPTAGLHFNTNKIKQLKDMGINFDEITLHVGLSTFQPIKTNISSHSMHSEKIIFTKQNIQNLIDAIKSKKKIIATGTTSLRTIESIYWLAVKSIINNDIQTEFEQFEWTNLGNNYNSAELLSEFLNMMEKYNLSSIIAETKLFIIPGYQFKLIDGLITNFHMPKSTLILLVAAFLGKSLWRKVYNEALNNDYRFLSYGDTSLLF